MVGGLKNRPMQDHRTEIMSHTDRLLDALTRHKTPHYTNVHDLGFLVSPHGIPYIPLPAPHDAYCLTNFLPVQDVPGGENDAEIMTRLMNTPEGQDGLGRTKYGEITLESTVNFMNRMMSAPQRGWCAGVIRNTQQVATMGYPPLIGSVSLRPNRFEPLDPEDDVAWTEKEKHLPDEQCHWTIAALVDSEHGGKGMAVAALRHIMEIWYVPSVQTFPGQLVSAYFCHNTRSKRMHEKLGFRPVAISRRFASDREKLLPEWRERTDELKLVCCVWQGLNGEWAIEKEDTIFRNLPPYEARSGPTGSS